jgi:DNA-binding NtrC family response regulator
VDAAGVIRGGSQPLSGAARRGSPAATRRGEPARVLSTARPPFAFHGLIGRTPAMQQLFGAITRFAPHARATLVTGETGTGKATVARTLYQLGPRRGGAFVTVACAAGAAEDGPWSARVANAADADPTLYFADVADLPVTEQTRLAQLLAAGDGPGRSAAGAHVIAATSQDLPAAIVAGRFRPDLYYRLGVFTLHVPPLRDRLDDLPDLAAAFLRDIAVRLQLRVRGVTPAALRVLQLQLWPGNLRELHNVLERAAVLSDDDMVGEAPVRLALSGATATDDTAHRPAGEAPGRLDDAQRAHIRGVLQAVHGNKTHAADRLGISRRALYRLLDRLGA